jgi:hypothetical protein
MSTIRIGNDDFVLCKITQILLGSECYSLELADSLFIKIRPSGFQDFPRLISNLVYEQPLPVDNSLPNQASILVDDNLVSPIMELFIKKESFFVSIRKDTGKNIPYVYAIKPFSETIMAKHKE